MAFKHTAGRVAGLIFFSALSMCFAGSAALMGLEWYVSGHADAHADALVVDKRHYSGKTESYLVAYRASLPGVPDGVEGSWPFSREEYDALAIGDPLPIAYLSSLPQWPVPLGGVGPTPWSAAIVAALALASAGLAWSCAGVRGARRLR